MLVRVTIFQECIRLGAEAVVLRGYPGSKGLLGNGLVEWIAGLSEWIGM
jgi:hypothetical protein